MTTYFIDPVQGDDRNEGDVQDRAWKGFIRLSEKLLKPGDRVEIIQAGDFHDSLHLRGSGSPKDPIRICFSKGRYDFFPSNMKRKRFDISNANSDAGSEKALAIYMEGVRHVRVEGEGADIVCRGKMIEVCLDTCEDVCVHGLRFDYHRPTVSEWKVLKSTEEWAEIQIHPDSVYCVENGKIRWLGEGWSETTGLAQELIPESHKVWRKKDPLLNLHLEDLGEGRVKAHGNHDMEEGRVFQIRNPFRDCVGIFLKNSKDVTFRRTHLAFMHGMGVLCQFSENITLEEVRISPVEESGRTTAAWADCTHFSGCKGKISLFNCLFNGAHDDAVNVHGTHLRILEKIGDRQLRVAFMHPQTFGFQAFYEGDEVEYVHANTLSPYGNATVEKVEILSPMEQLLTLNSPVPHQLKECDVLENVSWTPEVEIRGCRSMRIPTRGFLLTTRRRVVVEDNTFVSLDNGIHIESDAEGWFESGCVRDMKIVKNTFLSGKGPAIRISPHNSHPNSEVHRNIRIESNHFDLSQHGSALVAHGVSGLDVVDNVFEGGSQAGSDQIVSISQSEKVVLLGNEERSSSS